MNLEALTEFRAQLHERMDSLLTMAESLALAPADRESDQTHEDAMAEGIFIRAFTAYESGIERLFLHYVTGGAAMGGAVARSYLRVEDEGLARRITRGESKYLNWAKPSQTRATAENFIENGWPFVDMMATHTHVLSDCERVRNRIAHVSVESILQFGIVQRNFLATERMFELSAGQFLRIRNSRLRRTHLAHFIDAFTRTLDAIFEPPAA